MLNCLEFDGRENNFKFFKVKFTSKHHLELHNDYFALYTDNEKLYESYSLLA